MQQPIMFQLDQKCPLGAGGENENYCKVSQHISSRE